MSITYDAVARQVWLDQIAGAHPRGQPLCDDHAQRLSAPRGWVVLDRRDDEVAAPAVSPTETPAVAAPTSGLRFPRRWGQIDEARAEFRGEPDDGHTGAPLDPPTLEHGAAEQSDGLFDDDLDTMAKRKKKPDDPKRKKVSSSEDDRVDGGKSKHKDKDRDKAKGKSKSAGKKEKKPAAESDDEPVGDPLAPVASRPEVHAGDPDSEPLVPAPPVSSPTGVSRPNPKPPPTRPRRPARHDTLLQPKGRLLSRAFDAGGEQRSAITVRGDDEGTGPDESPDSVD